MRLSASPVNDENVTARKSGTVPFRFARLRQSLRSEFIFRAVVYLLVRFSKVSWRVHVIISLDLEEKES